MDGAVFEARLSDEGFALDQVESAPLLAGDAEGDHVARDRTLQLLRRTFGDDLAVVDDRDAVAKRVRLVEVVGREEYGRAAIVHPPHLVPHAGAALRVEPGGGLVEKQELRAMDQAQPDVEPPFLAARVRTGLPVGGALELEHVDELGGALLRGGGGHSVQAALEDELGAAGDLAVGAPRLADVTDPVADPVLLRGQVAARHARGAAAGRQKGGEHTQRRRLAGAVGAEKAEDLAGAHVEVYADHRLDLPLA